ncbi:MAG: hypothetical protein PW843_18760 [Azospirillaceae bacterium]|nr:hypothetical protein [Azospirillaceae bacterium]
MQQAQTVQGAQWWSAAPYDLADDQEKESGLSIILSPVQLAAILKGMSIEATETDTGRFMTRAFGALEIVGGAIEFVAAGALLITPEPTMATKVGGVVLAFDGADNVNTGLHDLWTGNPHNTLSYRAVRAAAESLGLSPESADKVGVAVEIAVPLGIAAKWAALRIISIRNGWFNLAVEDAAGGHTILKHISKDERYLRQRLIDEPGIPAAGTFTTRFEAEKFISQAVQANSQRIQQWAAAGTKGKLAFTHQAGQTVGWVIPRASGVMTRTSEVLVVLRRVTPAGTSKTYYILTAYPSI